MSTSTELKCPDITFEVLNRKSFSFSCFCDSTPKQEEFVCVNSSGILEILDKKETSKILPSESLNRLKILAENRIQGLVKHVVLNDSIKQIFRNLHEIEIDRLEDIVTFEMARLTELCFCLNQNQSTMHLIYKDICEINKALRLISFDLTNLMVFNKTKQ